MQLSVKFQYNFESERKAIVDYEKNKADLAVKLKEMETKNATPGRRSDVIVDRVSDIACELHTRKVNSGVILEPSRVVATTSQQVRMFIRLFSNLRAYIPEYINVSQYFMRQIIIYHCSKIRSR